MGLLPLHTPGSGGVEGVGPTADAGGWVIPPGAAPGSPGEGKGAAGRGVGADAVAGAGVTTIGGPDGEAGWVIPGGVGVGSVEMTVAG